MKKLIIIFVAVLFLAGAIIGVMKFMGLGPFKDPDKVVEAPKPKEEEALFVDMEPLIINIVRDGEIVATVQMELKLECVGTKDIIAIKRLLPKLKDAFMKDMHAFVPRMLSEIQRLDLPTIKARLFLVSNRVTPRKGMVRDVLIQSLLDSPVK